MNKQTFKRVALYGRYSSDMQNPQSVADQFRQCERYAERHDWIIVERFDDSAISGSTSHRPGFQALSDALASKSFDIVLTESLDRISRDQEHMARFYKQAQYHDVDIFTTGRGRVDALSLGLSSTIAAIYLEELASKTRRGLSGKVNQGLSGGGKSFGYKPDPDKTGELLIDEIEASVIRRIFRDFANGVSPLKIATALNDEGIPSPSAGSKRGSSGHWKQNTINGNAERGTGILNNELYIGRRIWNRLRYSKNPHTKKRISKPNDPSEWQISEVPHLRILDQDLWEAVKARQASQKKARRAKPDTDLNRMSSGQTLRRRKYLLSGLMKCGICGGNMTVAGTGKYKSYYCANAKEKGASICTGMPGIHESKASTIVLSTFREELMRPEAFALFRDQVHQQLS